jgi:hypothetical protein
MFNPLFALVNSQAAENHTLFSLLFYIHLVHPILAPINIDGPLNQIDEDGLIVAVSMLELLLGVNTPDEYLQDATMTIRQLADKIRLLPKLSDDEFQKKLLRDISIWRSVVNAN